MNDITVFQAILGNTEPWAVKAVEVDTAKEVIRIEMEVRRDRPWACPTCHRAMHVHEWNRRKWRHLDTQQFQTWIEADVPTVRCSEHGAQTVQVPWAEPHARFTMLFERMAIALLQAMSMEQVRLRLGISWDEADGIKARAVARGQRRRTTGVMKHLRVDEKHAGYKVWLTLVSCVDGGKAHVVYVAQGKDQVALDPFWRGLTAEQLAGIESIAMDMSEAFTNSVLLRVPDGKSKLVYDRYHVAQHMNQAVDEVRRQEQAAMSRDTAKEVKGTRYWWLYRPDHLPQELRRRFRAVQRIAKRTALAWELKELLRAFWDCPDESTGRSHLGAWLRRALHTTLEPVRKVARMCRAHIENLLTYFAHRATNASAEAVNSRIQSLISRACGYRNPLRLITDIWFHLGDLDLEPRFVQ
jgi:transposase